MNNFLTFVGKAAITVMYIEGALLVNEWLKQAKLDTANKLSTTNEDGIDISSELDEIKSRLDGVEMSMS